MLTGRLLSWVLRYQSCRGGGDWDICMYSRKKRMRNGILSRILRVPFLFMNVMCDLDAWRLLYMKNRAPPSGMA
jgi:hypothetical protein